MKKIGVFVCHCGLNIARTVDVKRIAEEIGKQPGVLVSEDYPYMCSDPGQSLIRDKIKEYDLDRVVVASCSPTLHEPTFMRVLETAGLNKYCFQMANIREHCSWVHEDREEATGKALIIIKAALAKVRLLEPLEDFQVDVTPEALVVGGGIAGIQTSLDIAESGFRVHLVERDPSIGGHMAQLDKTFPTLDCSACILTPKMVDVAQHPNIELYTYAEVEKVDGFVGNFKATIKLKDRHIQADKCTGCDLCTSNCLVRYIPQTRAKPSVKTKLDKEMMDLLDDLVRKFGREESALIQVLQAVNRYYRYLPELSLKYLSECFDIPLTRVYHLATFYSSFSLVPRGEHLVRVCMGTACHARGAPEVLDMLRSILKIEPGQTTEDQKFTLQTVGCLGCCALGPVVVVDEDYYQMTPDKAEKIIQSYKKK
ncbi:NAD(P)H-dependent oxidoreductase subunit E [bacterium]|nr:NAD(P)H-dependent oxidoreductase subunit E [bacterium]